MITLLPLYAPFFKVSNKLCKLLYTSLTSLNNLFKTRTSVWISMIFSSSVFRRVLNAVNLALLLSSICFKLCNSICSVPVMNHFLQFR